MVSITRWFGLTLVAASAVLGWSLADAPAHESERRMDVPGHQRATQREASESFVPQIDAGLDPLVLLSWPNLKDGRVLDLPDGVIELRAENRSEHVVAALIELYPNGVRSRVRFPVREALMPPADARTFLIDLHGLGFDLDRLRSAASLRVLVRAHIVADNGDTGRVDHSFSPTIYFHKERRGSRAGEIRVYQDLTMQRRMGNGSSHQNPACTLTLGTPQFPKPPGEPGLGFALQMDIDPGEGDPQPDHTNTLLSGAPPQTDQIRFCFAIPVDTEDSFIAHDFAVNPVSYFNGSYVQTTIRTLPPQAQTLVDGEFVDEEGCITIDHVSQTGYRVSVTSVAQVPRTDAPGESNTLQVRTGQPINGNLGGWSWCTEADIAPGTTRWLYLNPGRLANLLGMSIWSLRRFSDGVGGETIIVYDRPCGSNPNNSCNTTAGHLEVNPLHNKFRYALSHEMGHAVFKRFYGFHPFRNGIYNVDAGGEACEWSQGAHGLHSKEFSSSAMTEGFAQFYATAVWNRLDQTGAWFHYYKEDYKVNALDGPVTVVDMEFDSEGGPTAYLDNRCSGQIEGFGVELDWARQFWDYMTNDGTKPTKLELLEQLVIAYGSNFVNPSWSNGNSNDRMAKAVQQFAFDGGTDFTDRWNDFALVNGVSSALTEQCSWTGGECSWSDCPCTADGCPDSDCQP